MKSYVVRCNHIGGCINTEHDWTVEEKVSTIPLTYTPTLREYDGNKLTTLFSPTVKLYTISEKTSTAMMSTRIVTRTSPKPIANNLGLNNREIIIYSIGAGTFAIFILTCSVCKHRYKQIYGNFKRYQTGNRQRIDITGNPQREISLEEIEAVYEEIDESNMIDNVANFTDNNVSVSNTNGRTVYSDNDYLTPYQPTDEDANTNTSNDNKSESSVSSGRIIQSTSNYESTSSSSDVQGIRSSYLNPYQPIIHSAEIHDYASTDCINEFDSSGSESLTNESGYMNPYQPMVPDRNLHEYKSVLGSLDGSGSSLSDA
ncbi:unnamed protein product [Mytilus coruscus]|uniref:Uncharacterized protein n=1 Tax=Mytilus coruscus TaxID=42192 RepID=A0A6J8AYS0_MYTCO|nr:unnamed protein product [Mytilus coruscus]